jgi:hypothetical protein
MFDRHESWDRKAVVMSRKDFRAAVQHERDALSRRRAKKLKAGENVVG